MNWKRIKKREKRVKSPKTKSFSRKKASFLVIGGLSVLFVFSAIGAIRANVISMNTDKLYSRVTNLEKQKVVEVKETVDFPTISNYALSFTNEYVNLDSKAEEDEKKSRLNNLSKYVSFDVSQLEEQTVDDFSRTLKNATVTRIEEKKECYLVYVTIVFDVETKDGVNESIEDFVLPIKAGNDLYSIVSRPFFVSSQLEFGKTEPLEQVKNSFELEEKEKKDLEKFLTLFFAKYALGDKEELLLLMKEPELVSGNEKLKNVDSSTIQYFDTKQKNVYGVQVSVSFENEETESVRAEDFTLFITKTENSYFVNTLKHYFTESEE